MDETGAVQGMPNSFGHWRAAVARRLMWFRRRYIPRLVWYGDEIDVGVTFTSHKLEPDDPMRSLFEGHLASVEAALHDAGITFDRGIGTGGRDWEWDWSLRGPISVRFRGRAAKPEYRRERPRPVLVVDNVATPQEPRP